MIDPMANAECAYWLQFAREVGELFLLGVILLELVVSCDWWERRRM